MSKFSSQFSSDQLRALNQSQRSGRFHPLTCGGSRSDSAHRVYAAAHNDPDYGVLVATDEGWKCPVCGYSQSWVFQPAITALSALVIEGVGSQS